VISIEAPHFQRSDPGNAENVSFALIPYLGSRSESGSIALRPYAAARAANETSPADAPAVEYDFYLFNDTTSLAATLYVTNGLDTDPYTPMGYSLTLDGAGAKNFTRVLAAPATAGDLPSVWTDQVRDGVWTLHVALGAAKAGKHTLRWSVSSPEVYLEKIVLDAGGLKSSYLGPPETAQV
jgi:hypothetical protein